MLMIHAVMLFAVVLCGGHFVGGNKILIVSCPALSHMRELNTVGDELRRMGHQVFQVVGSHFSQLDKVTSTGIEAIVYEAPVKEDMMRKLEKNMRNMSPFDIFKFTVTGNDDECRYMMDDKSFLQKVKDMNFDLMIVDGLPLNLCRFVLPYHLGVPYVYQFSGSPEWALHLPFLPSFVPATSLFDNFHLSNRMSFFERVGSLLMMMLNHVMFPPRFLIDNSLLTEYAPDLSWGDLLRKSVLFIATRDHLLEYPVIGAPNVITTPGITIQPAEPLPENVEQLFRKAEHGVVVVSFGSLVGDLKQESVDTLFEGFSMLKQTVIMKYAGDINSARKKASANLHLLHWMPQNDMLGHNKTVAFVTHCGNNGQYEAVYHGVPMINMPFFGDQQHNAFRAVDHGYGLQLNFDTFTAQDLYQTITEVIENEKYSKKIKHSSAILKSDPVSPKAKIAYWIDHVMQYGGDHLRPASMDMSLPVVICLDVILFLIVILIIQIYISYRVIKRLCCKTSSKSKED